MRYYNAYGFICDDDWRRAHFTSLQEQLPFYFHDKFDPYAGLMIGARIPTSLAW